MEIAGLTIPEGDEPAAKKMPGNNSFDMNKVVPWFFVLAALVGWVVSYGRSSNSNDMLRVEVASQQAVLQDMSKQLAAQSERIARVETKLDSLVADMQMRERSKNGGDK